GSIVGATPVDDGRWHHIAVVSYDRVEISEIYVDGILDSIATSAAEPINTTAGTVPRLGGSNHSDGYNFFGDVDELRLFPRALSQTEIQQIFASSQQASAAWHRRYFGNASLTGWELNLDGDSLNRLGEYAFGGDPRVSDDLTTGPEIHYNPVSGKIDIHFRRRNTPAAHGLIYSVQASRDLIDWDELTTTEVSVTPISEPDCLEEAFFTTDADSSLEPRLFGRVLVELSEIAGD
ncbi:MAG: LamG domain-containing protein, partial [Verrucomicrobiales bacterium]